MDKIYENDKYLFIAMKTLENHPNALDKRSAFIQKRFEEHCKIPDLPCYNKYNLTISHQSKFIWFRVAKVGTRTILSHLRNSNLNLDVDHASNIRYPLNRYKGYFKFGFVRNPWERLLSCWKNKVVESNHFKFRDDLHAEMTKFNNFVEYVESLNITSCDRHLRLQSSLIDLNEIDYLGRYENFEDDLKSVFKTIGVNTNEINWENQSKVKVPLAQVYDKKLIEKVASIYQKDIKIFGYDLKLT